MAAHELFFAGLWIEMDALVYFTISCSNIPLVYCLYTTPFDSNASVTLETSGSSDDYSGPDRRLVSMRHQVADLSIEDNPHGYPS